MDNNYIEEIRNLSINELNIKLYDACIGKEIDYAYIEALLKHGADPMGRLDDKSGYIYGEILTELYEHKRRVLPITKLFLKYGMKIVDANIDDDWCYNPIWLLTFHVGRSLVRVLRLLIESGLEIDSIMSFVEHTYIDTWVCADYVFREEWYLKYVADSYRMIMLCASYDHILEDNQYLKSIIDYSKNNYDIKLFRHPYSFYARFDLSNCIDDRRDKYSCISFGVLTFYEKKTDKPIWRIVLGNVE